MQSVNDFAWRELAVLALFLWLLYRYTTLTLATALIAVGLAALIVLPVDLTSGLLSLAAIGAGWACWRTTSSSARRRSSGRRTRRVAIRGRTTNFILNPRLSFPPPRC